MRDVWWDWKEGGSVMETMILLVCVAGLAEFKIPDICMAYTLEPQYEMTQPELDSKIIYLCEQGRAGAIAHGGFVTRCEIVDEVPANMKQVDPVIEEIKL